MYEPLPVVTGLTARTPYVFAPDGGAVSVKVVKLIAVEVNRLALLNGPSVLALRYTKYCALLSAEGFHVKTTWPEPLVDALKPLGGPVI